MGLRACVSIHSLPLQILLRENPGWAGTPVAVTQEERPQSRILALNREAGERGLRVGMRYANGLSLIPNLRARSVPAERIAAARGHIVQTLIDFTPDIELCPFDTDALWASVEGLRSLYATEARWSQEVRRALQAEGLRATVVVGFTRFGTYAVARARARSLVFATRDQEKAIMLRSPVDFLPLPGRTRSTLRKLEVRIVSQFVSLPEGETSRRFGKDAGLLRRAILSDDPLPIRPLDVREKTPCRRHLDAPVSTLDLLMPCILELLGTEVRRAGVEHTVISGLTLVLRTEEGNITTDLVRPSIPTLSTALLGRLVQLRLSARQFSSGVEDIEIRSTRARPSRTQEELFDVKGRDLEAGARAFAAIRARFGNTSVVRAELQDSYLPERSFRWVPLTRPVMPAALSAVPSAAPGAVPPAPRPVGKDPHRQTSVRRILWSPRQLPRGPGESPERAGPFVLSGSWWGAGSGSPPFHREYFFHRSAGGVLWLYVDRLTGTTWVQGAVD